MAGNNVKELTDQNFDTEVLQSSEPVLVDFTAVWCPPCKMLSPTIDKLADEYRGKLKVGKVDADESRDVTLKYRINALPTVLIFKNGQVVKQLTGLRKEAEYREAIDNAG